MVTEPVRSVFEAFERSAAQHAARPFLRVPASAPKGCADGVGEYSYQSARHEVSHLVSAYAARGIDAGDRVTTCLDSRLELYLHLLALNALGASLVPVASAASDDEIRHIVSHSDSTLIVSTPEQVERLAMLKVGTTIAADALAGQDIDDALPQPDPRTEAALLYTSGTTGKPKGCMLSNAYFLGSGEWYNGLGGLCAIGAADRLLTPLPPNHMNALCTSFMAMLMCGGCVIQVDRFHPREWWRTVREENASIIHCLGVMVAILLTLPEADDSEIGGQVRFAFAPGSDPRHQGLFEARFGVPLVEAWAMTESGGGGVIIAHDEPRHVGERCIGRPIANTECRIVDERDADVAKGDPGELLVRAAGSDPRRGFFSGYHKDEAATEAGWRGGWWHTGDVVREGADGSLHFVDRRKNLIRRSGENIAAVEVEAVLLSMDAVDNCAVCAVPDELRGDEVFAFVVANRPVTARQVLDHCLAYLTYFKAPGHLAFVDALPVTASQKVSRGEVKQLARASVLAGACEDLRAHKKRPSG